MAKPIPVFEFAFAAYAATVGAGAEKPIAAPELRPFEATWRSMGSRDGSLLVKIGVLDCGQATTPCGSMLPREEIWVGQVKETASGYSGVVCGSRAPLRNIEPGVLIEFGPADILDWTISYESLAGCPALRKRSKPAAGLCYACNLAVEALG
jgi:hypothetical protein